MHIHFLTDGKAISSLKDKNRVVAQNWKSLSEGEKQRYYEDAKQGSTGSNDSDYQHTWKETSRIIRNLNNTVGVFTCIMIIYLMSC